MGLRPLEFSECYLDSPQFRDRLKSHEVELEKTNKFIKDLIKDGKALIQALKNLSSAKRKFAESLNEFKFQCIGDTETDDEICIARSLQEFAGVLKNLEDERGRLIENASEVLITPLERFRKEQIGAAKEAKKKYDKETEKYCSVLEKHLNLSSKKKETHLQEADCQVDVVRKHFYEVSLEYVFRVHEVQERKMFEFVEPLLAFLQGVFTFYHHGYELAKDFGHFKTQLQISIQNTRNRFEGTRPEVESLMTKMKENPLEHQRISPFTMEGYLFVQKKSPFGSSWVKHYCTYQRESKRVTMVPFDQKTGGKVGDEELFTLKLCTRRKTDSIEKRFCFDVEGVDRTSVITMQAFSEEDRRLWIEAMDGREPVRSASQLDKVGFNLVKKCIQAIEERGINEQGLYRIAGVNSRVQKLLGILMGKCGVLFPLSLYSVFCFVIELDNQDSRLSEIHRQVHRLPEKNKAMLEILIKHLANVSNNHKQNLMPVANLGVVFGPTLLRPQEETVAAIMEIKFQNIVVEILIENQQQIFQTVPDSVVIQTNPLLNSAPRKSGEGKPPLCSQRPLMLFQTSSTENGTPLDPSPSSPLSPSLPMISAPSSPVPVSSTSNDSSPLSPPGRKARSLYACKAEHESELSFSAGTMFENVHPSREPGWLEGTLDGKTGLIPENYVEFL
uniref:Rho GTPase-activating protein 26 n=1 Tax=Callorhinchus milii TaxID=7868 RepID=A0A4W3HAZ3_CALMI